MKAIHRTEITEHALTSAHKGTSILTSFSALEIVALSSCAKLFTQHHPSLFKNIVLIQIKHPAKILASMQDTLLRVSSRNEIRCLYIHLKSNLFYLTGYMEVDYSAFNVKINK